MRRSENNHESLHQHWKTRPLARVPAVRQSLDEFASRAEAQDIRRKERELLKAAPISRESCVKGGSAAHHLATRWMERSSYHQDAERAVKTLNLRRGKELHKSRARTAREAIENSNSPPNTGNLGQDFVDILIAVDEEDQDQDTTVGGG